ncbi:MAG: hypothetical protein [Microvirus sp.]|nr:MAG: hypothetical protein [Microvirus sp.]
MKRHSVHKRKDRKVFSQTSKPHPSNSTVSSVMRGGIRK